MKEKNAALGSKTLQVFSLVMRFCKDIEEENLMKLVDDDSGAAPYLNPEDGNESSFHI
jgi:hypothetical protein